MANNRPGQDLWMEWEGENFPEEIEDSVVFYTVGPIDLDHPVVLRALASQLQILGLADSLGHGYRMLDHVHPVFGWLGIRPGDEELSYFADLSVYELFPDQEESITGLNPGTWVEIDLGDH